MIKKFQILAVLLAIPFVCSSAGNEVVTFSQTLGGTGTENAYAIAQTKDNGFVVVGETNSSGAGDLDFWLVKLDEKGNKLWDKTLGGPNADSASAVVAAPDGGFAVAGTSKTSAANGKDFLAAKLDASGNVIWQKTFGGAGSDIANSIELTSDGGYILAGMTMSFPKGNKNAWILRLDANGDKVWDKVIGGPKVEVANSIRQTTDNGFIMAGYTTAASTKTIDVWVAKLDANAVVVWQKTFGGAGEDRANSAVSTDDGGYLVAGTTYSHKGEFDYWVIKLDANGEKTWDKTFGGSKWDEAWDAQQTADGNFLVIGSTQSYGDIYKDLLILKLDKNGEKIWSKIYGGAGFDYGHSLALARDGGFVVAGSTTKTGSKTPDFWVLKLDANGDCGGVSCVKPKPITLK